MAQELKRMPKSTLIDYNDNGIGIRNGQGSIEIYER